jgi:arylsulfatase A-like enzyme
VAPGVIGALVTAACAALVAGTGESLVYVDGTLARVAAAGFAALYAVPLGALGACLVRLLLWAWRPATIAAALVEETGGAPRLAAWLAYTGFALWAIAAVTFHAARLLLSVAHAHDVVALACALIVVTAAGILIALSRPGVTALAAGFRRLDRGVHRRRGRSPLTPRLLLVAAALVVVLWCWLAWVISIGPRVGHFDWLLLLYPVLFVAGLAGSELVWYHLRAHARVRAALAVGVALAGAAALGTAFHVRYRRPFVMLDIWAAAPTAGLAIEIAYDLGTLRSTLDLSEVAPAARPGASHPDVLLVTIDTVRADRTPPYGGWAEMPSLAELAQRGAVFEWAFAPGNVTRRSLPTIATGVSPRRIRGRVAGWALRLDPRHVLLAERFRAAGYDTAGFFCCESQFGPVHELGTERGIEHLVIDYDGAKLATLARDWLRRRDHVTAGPAFVWLHFIEPHGWEKRARGTPRGRPHARYDSVLAEVDGFLATLLEPLQDPARRNRTIVAVTSDHGEGLGDHGHTNHAMTLYSSETRVPLILVGPGVRPGRVAAPVGLVDLAPTLLDLAGYVPPGMPAMDGGSVADRVRGVVPDVPGAGEAYLVMVPDRSVQEEMVAIVAGRHKLIERPRRKPMLYDLAQDPGEKQNLAKDQPAIVEDLRRRISQRRAVDAIPPF